jgi:nitroimidazol reductase NimA-like FMN-containing flavoprotein (pyridoxamine 5'-phosphate oxidase superfamily)
MDRQHVHVDDVPPPSARTKVRRKPDRGVYDRSVIERILAEAFICHVGYEADGYPCVIPTAYGVADGMLYLHGSTKNRTLTALRDGTEVCVTVTLIDGLVLARSAFHHSLNYRSVVIFGHAREIVNEDEQLLGLRAIVEHICPGRWEDVRKPSAKELRSTLLLGIPVADASAKVRTGPPRDQQEDVDLSIWAGELPMQMGALPAVTAPNVPPELTPPPYVLDYTRPSSALERPGADTSTT